MQTVPLLTGADVSTLFIEKILLLCFTCSNITARYMLRFLCNRLGGIDRARDVGTMQVYTLSDEGTCVARQWKVRGYTLDSLG